MGVIRMREAHSSYDECQRRYQIGSSTCQLIMKRFKSIGLSFQDLQKMDEQKVVDAFYPPDQARRKKLRFQIMRRSTLIKVFMTQTVGWIRKASNIWLTASGLKKEKTF